MSLLTHTSLDPDLSPTLTCPQPPTPHQVHAVSTALVGSQLHYDSLRFAIYRELRDHRAHYESVGFLTPDFKARFEKRLLQAAEEAHRRG